MNPENTMTAEEYRHRLAGARSKYSGQRFEDRIEASLHWYETAGLMRVRKTPEPMKPIKALRDGRFVAVFTKPAQVDFSGTLAGGISIRFEAKQTETDRLQRSRLSLEQLDDLGRHDELGAICFILACFGDDRFYRIPWANWRDMKEIYGRQYLKESDIEEFRLPETSFGLIEILHGLRKEDGGGET